MGEVTHHIKCWPEPFAEMLAGRKTAEFRLNDRNFQTGDTLLIREWCPVAKQYTHREITRQITHVLDKGFGLPKGYAMLSLTTAQAEIEALKAERDKLASIVRGWHYLAVGPDEMGDYYTHKQLVKASEPYASPALKALSGSKP